MEPGSQVTVEVDQHKKVKKVKAHAAEAEGAIKSIDSAEQTVTISLEKGGEVTLGVTAETRIEVDDDERATFAALQVGQEIEAAFDVETQKAFKIEVEDDGDKDDEDEVKGAITAIDNGAKTVTIRAANGTEAALRITAVTELDLDGVGTFANLKTGMRMETDFNSATKELSKLEVKDDKRGKAEEEKSELEGAITSIDANAKTVTVRDKNGSGGTFKVVTGTRLDEVGAFGDLKTGTMVHAKFNDTTKELVRLKVQREEQKAELERIVTAINADAKTVTIRAQDDAETILKATARTEFKRKGAATLTDIKTGMQVEARFNPNTNDLVKLEVKD